MGVCHPRRGRGATPARALMLGLIVVGGCGGEPRLESVSGIVKHDGAPLRKATIRFTPEADGGLTVGSVVEEGAYRLPNPPGLAPGRYVVGLSFTEDPDAPAGAPPDRDLAAPGGGERLPARYNEKSELRAEVKAGASNTFDFELAGKRDPKAGRANRR
jgi:hypothetical protein